MAGKAMNVTREALAKSEKDFIGFRTKFLKNLKDTEHSMKVVRDSGWQDEKFKELDENVKALVAILKPLAEKMYTVANVKKEEQKILDSYINTKM